MKKLFTEKILERIKNSGIIAVLIIDNEEDAVPLAEALLAGGINIMELTLRTPAALGAIRQVKANCPDMMCGAGTVLTVEQVEQVAEAGADFAVAPGMNSKIVAKAKEIGLPFAPGISTPSDIEAAIEHGCRLLKFFPAESAGGLKHLKNISAPYNFLNLQFIPLGGLNLDNMGNYLDSPSVIAIGGSWIAKQKEIKANNWELITANAKAAMQARCR
jgi:2-dehydro-3-deoxyphosphogluconate aldolase / (4S)-4-hydroxy-2-oxoglutarate aldolase